MSGERLNPRMTDLHCRRETFAERLKGQGIGAEATGQATVGEPLGSESGRSPLDGLCAPRPQGLMALSVHSLELAIDPLETFTSPISLPRSRRTQI